MKNLIATLATGVSLSAPAFSQELPKASVQLAAQAAHVKIYTVVAPPEQFSNTTHVIELPHELVVIDGQFFAPYAWQVKALTDSLHKPVTRFYISHDHPDHYIGFGDAFPDVPVYALAETKAGIEQAGQQTLEQRQKQFGDVIAKKLNLPTHIQQPGTEVIDGVKFIFEVSHDNEAALSLVVKVPEVKAYIAQDIVYNNTHLFISGNSDGWRKALHKIEKEHDYTLILPGHGKPADRSVLKEDLQYLDFVDQALAASKTKEEYKAKLLAAYPGYGGAHLIDIYLAYYLKKDWGK
ncbi:Glyoxylase, beta-lactamase superfamily II [Filimonas lacunae]|uniref:Glyoxylase, beta-lactamase superfamily II n=1 Tax=Filimonas lacunae TaxID=477680 RepID=A0A173MGW3_9BACT|nr:hypothetical protein [Filimonas lacunae]BAV06739.1 metallo beta lactamase superfamily protein [Filimonas lacunae]SIT34435.1 Glyoxylase, beta-lactamase superfamily II [Filimonas lacunae]